MTKTKKWLEKYADHISKEVEVPNISVSDMLLNTTNKVADNKAIHFFGKEYTYQEVTKQSQAFAAGLQGKGVLKGDRVAIMLPNCPHYVISYYGTLFAGGIVTQVNPMLVGRELLHLLKDSGAETIVIYEPLLPVLQEVIDETDVKQVISVNFTTDSNSGDQAVDFMDFLKQVKNPPEIVDINPKEDIAVLQYTGGTTGRSKGAMLTHENIVANTVQVEEYFQDAIEFGKDRYLTVIPLFHVFAMTSGMNLSIYTGAMNILLPRFEVDEVLETIKELQPTSFPGVPTMYVALNNHPKTEDYGLDSIKICNSGSAPMPLELMRSFENKTGAKVLEGFGLSEASPVTHCNPLFSTRKPGSIGIGVPSTDYKIVDLSDGIEEVPVGELGELIIKGPQVMKGYWNLPEETEMTIRDGWLYTGDIARVDEEGYAFIVDRKKDLIIASGYNVYPRDVEEVLYEHPAVMEAVVVGVPDEYRGETVKAVIVLKEDQSVTEEDLIDYAKGQLSAYKVPRMIEFRDELPKTNVGKILRRKIREENLQS